MKPLIAALLLHVFPFDNFNTFCVQYLYSASLIER